MDKSIRLFIVYKTVDFTKFPNVNTFYLTTPVIKRTEYRIVGNFRRTESSPDD